jgi:hypothetical protein
MATPIETEPESPPAVYVPMALHKNKELWRAIRRYGDAIEEEYMARYTVGFVAGFLTGFGLASVTFCFLIERAAAHKSARLFGF